MADTTSGHGEAVKAVSGQLDPEEVRTTRDLKSEQQKDKKLDEEASKALGDENPFTASLEGKERKQRAVRTLANGKTEALLEEAPAAPVFPPDDGGYNPERRFYAGPDNTKVPSAIGKNRTTSTPVPVGWREDEIKD